MATAAPQTEMWTVFVEAEEQTRMRVYKHPTTTTIREVAASYATDVGDSAENVVFVSSEGRVLPPHVTLLEIGETFPNSRIIKLVPESGIQVEVEIYRMCGARKSITVRPTSLPEDIHPIVRSALALDGERMFRLRTADSVFKYNLSLSEQGVGRGTVISVDLAFEVEVEDVWEGTVVNRFVYSSESCEDMLAEEVSVLKSDGQTLNTSREVIDAFFGLGGPNVSVSLHSQKQMAVMDDRTLRQGALWPADELRRIKPRCPGLAFEGEQLPSDCAVSKLDLPEHSLLVSRPARLEVRLRSGKRLMLRLPKCATVGDLRAAVRIEEETEEFSLTRGQEAVDENEEAGLDAVGAPDGGPLDVVSREDSIVVRLRERSVRWSSGEGSLRFSGIMAKVASETDLLYKNLMARSLHCAGCGRRVWAEEEEAQVVPVACCKIRSLVLEEPAPPAVANAGTQTRRGQRSGPTRHSSVSVFPSTEERGVQAYARWRQAACQTEGTARKEVGAQAALARSSFAAQHPPPLPSPPPVPFLLRYGTGRRDVRDVSCDLRLGAAPTVGEVRAAAAAVLDLNPRQVWFRRRMVQRGALVLVCDAEGRFLHPGDTPAAEFGDAAGRVLRRDKAGEWEKDFELQTLSDDAAPFLVVPGRRNTVVVYKR